ncbi:MAG: hypothetical protein EOO47_20695 [Flavobacterium sp.]|nr:MAG: hypothetical protein EOO47_20695 [Flavobacterium sp.]
MQKQKISIVAIILFISLSSFFAHAQHEETKTKDTTKKVDVFFEPLFLLNEAIKLDVSYQLNQPRIAVIGGFEIYNGKTNILYDDINKEGELIKDNIEGFGINLGATFKLSKHVSNASFYLSPGLTYRSLDLKISGPMFYTFVENGLEYITYGNAEQKFHINSVLIYGKLGYSYAISNLLVFDVYGGFGYKTATNLPLLKLERKYDENAYGYNYKGLLPLGGVKFGLRIL